MRTFLALLTLSLAACDAAAPLDAGGLPGDGGPTDAPEGDAGLSDAPSDTGSDAPTDVPTDAFVPPLPVTVVVTDGTTPHPGARVAFFDAAGVLVASAITGADGRASQLLEPGSMVVAIPSGPADNIQSFVWMGVAPGDVLPLVRRPDPSSVLIDTAFRVPTLAGAVRWQLDTECGLTNTFTHPIVLGVPEDCALSDVVATYFDGASEVLGTVSALDQPISPGTELDLSARRARPLRPATITFSGLPPETVYASLEARVRFGSVMAPVVVDTTTSTSGTMSASGSLPDTAEGGEVRQLARVVAFGGSLSVERVGPSATPLAYAEVAMPVISGVGYTPSLRRLTVTVAGSGAITPDASYVQLTVIGPGQRIDWHIFSPVVDEIVLPTLPAEMADAELPLDATPSFDAFRIAAPGTYDALRLRAYTLRSISDLLEGPGDLIYAYASNRS
jgi:hypothetical protein